MLTTDACFNIEQGKSVGPQIYECLKKQIVKGDMKPGTRISEAEISRCFDVSRQPVREAFIKLGNDGLVEVRPQRGTFVTKISVTAVSDARFIREAIEADLVKLLAAGTTPEIVAELRSIVEAQRQVSEKDIDRFMELDELLHRTIAELAGKPIAWQVIGSMKTHFDRVRYLSSATKPLALLIQQHSAVIDAIEEGDPLKAEIQIRTHLQEVLRDLPEIISKQPELFSETGQSVH